MVLIFGLLERRVLKLLLLPLLPHQENAKKHSWRQQTLLAPLAPLALATLAVKFVRMVGTICWRHWHKWCNRQWRLHHWYPTDCIGANVIVHHCHYRQWRHLNGTIDGHWRQRWCKWRHLNGAIGAHWRR